MANPQAKNAGAQDMNQLLKVRRDKLEELRAAGQDPFQITKYDVTHHSTDIRDNFEELEGKTVTKEPAELPEYCGHNQNGNY